jgi:hypothetical protein
MLQVRVRGLVKTVRLGGPQVCVAAAATAAAADAAGAMCSHASASCMLIS